MTVAAAAALGRGSGASTVLPTSAAGLRLWTAASIVLLAAVLGAPLASYLILLAIFGLAHVIAELRYVDQRFSARIGMRLLPWIGAGLALVLLARLAGIAGWTSRTEALGLELAAGLALAALALAAVEVRRWWIAGGLALVALAAALRPIDTLLAVALLHNLTPLAFLAELLPPGERGRVLGLLGVPYLLLPLAIAFGVPQAALAGAGWAASDWAPFDLGPIGRHLGAFVAPALMRSGFEENVFAAAVFAQGMHYLGVIVVLPRLLSERGAAGPALVPWPPVRAFAIGLAGTMVLTGLLFALDFGQARAWYGLAAALHTWLEGPVLLLALGLALRGARESPVP